jgi:hypothetical protein
MVSTTGQQEHNENAEQVKDVEPVAVSHISAFDVARDVEAFEAAFDGVKHDEEQSAKLREQEHISINIGKSAPQDGDSGQSTILASAIAERKKVTDLIKNRKNATADALMLAEYNRVLADLNTQLTHYTERLEVVSAYVEALEDALEQIQNGEEYLNADGTLKDERAEEALREIEELTGMKIDRDDPEAIKDALVKYKQDEVDLSTLVKRTQDDIDRVYEEAKADFGDNAPALIEAAANSDFSASAEELINLGVNGLETLEDKINVSKQRNFNESDQEKYANALTDDNVFSTIGTDNPFFKGQMTNSFGSVSNNFVSANPFQTNSLEEHNDDRAIDEPFKPEVLS